MKYFDHTGKTFGYLTVIERIPVKGGKAKWKCQCKCGNIVYPVSQALVLGTTKSCGCKRTADLVSRNSSHNLSHNPSYRIWVGMMDRCHNEKSKKYYGYGERGIKVCQRWHDVENFINDMGERPSPKHSIDRIDVNGNYEPENCRWATPMEQGSNKRNLNMLSIDGKEIHLAEASRLFNIPENTIRNRLNSGMTHDEAIKVPVSKKNQTYEFYGQMLTIQQISNETGIKKNTIRHRLLNGKPIDAPLRVWGK